MIITKKEARDKILQGTQKLCDVVGLTLGPKGRNVIIERNGMPFITNDGIAIARHVKLEDKFENLGSSVLLQASAQTNQVAGDGTTSAIVLGNAIMQNGMKAIESGANPIEIKEGLLAAADIATIAVKQNSAPAGDLLESVAINSCQNKLDGEIVAKAFQTVGEDGVMTIEETRMTGSTSLIFQDGCEVDAMLVSPLFSTDQARMESSFENAIIFISDKKVAHLKDLIPLLEKSANDKSPLVIIAPEYSQEVIQALLVNKLRAGITVAPMKWKFVERATASSCDLAALCNTIINEETGIAVATVAKIVCSTLGTTVFAERNELLEKRLITIKSQIETETDEYSKAQLKKRLAKLIGGIATINICAPTEIETKEKRLRIEDAIAAVKAASDGGITEGGGMSYLKAKTALKNHKFEPRTKVGATILIDSLDSITCQIARNAGVDPDVVIKNIVDKRKGYNAMTGEYQCLLESGIIDPTQVVIQVIQNATSAAATLLTTDAIISEKDA